MSTSQTYFITWKGRRDGPYSREQLENLLKNGDIGLLHRVETSTGQMSLQQLLDEGRAPTPVAHVPSSNTALSGESATPPIENIGFGEREALRIYALCGFCFLLPPLAYWVWDLARKLEARGLKEVAQNIKLMALGFAAGGLIMWALLWRYG